MQKSLELHVTALSRVYIIFVLLGQWSISFINHSGCCKSFQLHALNQFILLSSRRTWHCSWSGIRCINEYWSSAIQKSFAKTDSKRGAFSPNCSIGSNYTRCWKKDSSTGEGKALGFSFSPLFWPFLSFHSGETCVSLWVSIELITKYLGFLLLFIILLLLHLEGGWELRSVYWIFKIAHVWNRESLT